MEKWCHSDPSWSFVWNLIFPSECLRSILCPQCSEILSWCALVWFCFCPFCWAQWALSMWKLMSFSSKNIWLNYLIDFFHSVSQISWADFWISLSFLTSFSFFGLLSTHSRIFPHFIFLPFYWVFHFCYHSFNLKELCLVLWVFIF